jgi:DNA-binding response OmpR family regulator
MNFLKSLFGNKEQTSTPTTPAPVKKIVIVEDDKYLRDFYAELLTSEGFSISTAENGQLGLQTIIAQKPNLVLLDLMMPVMDGKTVLHQMRQLPEFKTTPVIILTNAGTADNIRETKLFDNANEFLVKSNITPDELLNTIRTFI